MSIQSNSTMEFQVYLKISEEEARALKAITTFSSKDFLECFYQKLGKSDLQPHEQGLISLFETIRAELPSHLTRFTETRKVFKQANPNSLIQ